MRHGERLFEVLRKVFVGKTLTVNRTKDGEIFAWERLDIKSVGMSDDGDVYFLGDGGFSGIVFLGMIYAVALADKGTVSYDAGDGYYYTCTLNVEEGNGNCREEITNILNDAYVGKKLNVKLFEIENVVDDFSFVVTHIKMDDDMGFHPYGEWECEIDDDYFGVGYAIELADKGYLGIPKSGGWRAEYTLETEE